jgi:hypothetical protein
MSAALVFFCQTSVNDTPPCRVVDTSKEFSMTITAPLSAWPEDERDRKR